MVFYYFIEIIFIFTLVHKDVVVQIFQISKAENFLGAVAVVHASGFPIKDIIAHLNELTNVPGRFELVGDTPKGRLKLSKQTY